MYCIIFDICCTYCNVLVILSLESNIIFIFHSIDGAETAKYLDMISKIFNKVFAKG